MESETDELTTQDVAKKLENMGFDMSSQKNASASVHAILSRLAERGKIEKITADGGAVSWRGPKYDPDYIPF